MSDYNMNDDIEITDSTDMDDFCEEVAEDILRSRMILDGKLKSMLAKLDDIESKLNILKNGLGKPNKSGPRFAPTVAPECDDISSNLLLHKSPSFASIPGEALQKIYGKERAKEYETSDSETEEPSDAGTSSASSYFQDTRQHRSN